MVKHTDSRITTPRILLAGFAIIILLTSGLSALSLYYLGTYSTRLTDTIQERNQRQSLAFSLRRAARERTVHLYAMVNSDDPFERDQHYQAVLDEGEKFMQAHQTLEDKTLPEAEQELLERISQLAQRSSTNFHVIAQMTRMGDIAKAREVLIQQAAPAADQLFISLNEFIHLHQSRYRNLLLKSADDFQTIFTILLPLSALVLLLIIAIAVFVSYKTRHYITTLATLSGELRSHRHREEAILQGLFDGVITADERGIIQDFNRAAEEIFGYSAGDVIGHPINLLMPEQDSKVHDQYLSHAASSGQTRMMGFGRELMGRRQNGSEFPIEIALTDIQEDGHTLYIATVRDITTKRQHAEERRRAREELEQLVEKRTAELSRANEMLQELANHDSLTGLANRRLFTELLRYELAQSRRNQKKLALLYLDLDGFKPVNDELGHEAGDALLQEVGRHLCNTIRGQDAIARIGGDEFTVILNEVDNPDDAEIVAKRVIQTINQPMTLKNRSITISVSIGISCYPEHGDDVDSLLHHADQAMYQAKHTGKNRYCFYRPDQQ